MVIFYSYVKLPEGTRGASHIPGWWPRAHGRSHGCGEEIPEHVIQWRHLDFDPISDPRQKTGYQQGIFIWKVS